MNTEQNNRKQQTSNVTEEGLRELSMEEAEKIRGGEGEEGRLEGETIGEYVARVGISFNDLVFINFGELRVQGRGEVKKFL